ncbi:Anti-sigma-28 factor, FlgM [compost metagenome]
MKKGKKDEVQISAEAKEMLSSVQNSDKIEELKEAVSNGTYQVDARKLAEKIWPFVK